MANFKHKVLLLIAKWIPVAVAAGILINNTLAMIVICLVRRAIRLARLFSCNYGWKWGF